MFFLSQSDMSCTLYQVTIKRNTSSHQKSLLIISVFVIILVILIFLNKKTHVSTTPDKLEEKESASVIFNGSRDFPLLALTFDADMTPNMAMQMKGGEENLWYNDKVVSLLESTQTPATIFYTGLWIEKHPQVSKKLMSNPLFESANHSYSHYSFTKNCYNLKPLSEKEKEYEIQKTQDIIDQYTHKTSQYFRFPGGCFSDSDAKIVLDKGISVVQWDSVGHDAFNSNVQSAFERLQKQTQNGSIIVLHLNGGKNAPKTAEILSLYLPWARSRGYTFVTLSELISRGGK